MQSDLFFSVIYYHSFFVLLWTPCILCISSICNFHFHFFFSCTFCQLPIQSFCKTMRSAVYSCKAFLEIVLKIFFLFLFFFVFSGSVDHFICGVAAGFFAKLMVYPVDVVKKRLQVQGFEEARQSFGIVRKYNGALHCIYVSFRDEGLMFLYKGLSPSLIKSSAVAGINFCVYEYCCMVLARYQRSLRESAV